MLSRLLWVFVVFLGHCSFALKFSSVTGHVRLGDARGKVVGFVDFNADKATDILFQTGQSGFNSDRPILVLTFYPQTIAYQCTCGAERNSDFIYTSS